MDHIIPPFPLLALSLSFVLLCILNAIQASEFSDSF